MVSPKSSDSAGKVVVQIIVESVALQSYPTSGSNRQVSSREVGSNIKPLYVQHLLSRDNTYGCEDIGAT